jgi:hypothetical protein
MVLTIIDPIILSRAARGMPEQTTNKRLIKERKSAKICVKTKQTRRVATNKIH